MLFAQDPLEGASKAFARGNADVAMIAVAPFRTVQGTAWVIGAEFVEEVERGGVPARPAHALKEGPGAARAREQRFEQRRQCGEG